VAQIGAAIGRQFPYTLLRALCPLPEDELRSALTQLVVSELVSERGTAPDAVYAFKHALVRDAAYGSLLRNARRQLHARIAEALEAHSPEIMESHPELLAQHYAEAGLVEKSVAYWGKAARRSVARSAMAEAAAQLQKGLDELALLPDSPERQRQELELRSALGAVLAVVKGFAAPETGRAYVRARELWEQLDSPPEFLGVPYGHSRCHMFRGEFDLAQRVAEDLLRLGNERDAPAALVLGHYAFGGNLMFVGQFATARSHLDEALALYDPISHRSLVDEAEAHPHVQSQAFCGIVLFCLGYPDRASARSNGAIAEARRLDHPPSLASSLAAATRLLSVGGDDAALDERVCEFLAVTTEHGFPYWRPAGTIFRGWVMVKNGDVADGESLLHGGSTTYRATGAQAWVPYHIALLARACEIAGEIEEAVTQLDDAFQILKKTGERWFEAELYRQKGRLLLRQGAAEPVEKLYRKALSIAQEQEAKLWELRAAASLARLWRDQGRRAAARVLLAPVYSRFTEGFATPDLKAAKTLLDELQ
jgi:predicted ATPase